MRHPGKDPGLIRRSPGALHRGDTRGQDRTRLLVVATDEERMIAELTAEHLSSQHSGPVIVEQGVSMKTGMGNA